MPSPHPYYTSLNNQTFTCLKHRLNYPFIPRKNMPIWFYSPSKYLFGLYIFYKCEPVNFECALIVRWCVSIIFECKPIIFECEIIMLYCKSVILWCASINFECEHIIDYFLRKRVLLKPKNAHQSTHKCYQVLLSSQGFLI
jgi:hypothetical protein